MSTTQNYTIEVYNYSGQPRNYLLFQTVPVPSGQPDVFANVYQSSGIIESGDYSQATFEMTNEFFAVLGTAPTPLGDHVKVTTGAANQVTLSSGETPPEQPGTMCVLSTTEGLYPKWVDVTQTQNQEPNAYGISCDGTFEYPTETNIFIGMGARDPVTQGITPVATVPANPNYNFYFQPVVKYYIGTGDFDAGTVVNITEIGPVLTVDFTQSTENSVVFTQGPNNEYTPGGPSSDAAKKGVERK
ncbi:uncharacterized protein ACLA_094030 [Aspergillus clavatus NRRL 1]|uniref:Uncharacterized protein n=1 Tax=Aspergillus clavatus (strain ATCC 1007 / CBS 513.65 / DSM 816 / NCTC 3887 / NRRL 1 / QM 1276 / 107) TaxID=344612 RepID=A1CFQ5_ASPCL|nr:uncharacterized protein ACLA_094030 [Aspergillus clavatus NRRL 1]EAW11704.1 conserved hypothetical protein [Aspergillus clavatus NRRL 1]